MAFLTQVEATVSLRQILKEIISIARAIKSASTSMLDQSAAGDVSAHDIALLANDFQIHDDRLSSLETAPGLLQHAKDHFNDQTFNATAEVTSLKVATASTITWIDANIPKSAGGRWLEIEEIVAGRVVERTLTPAQTAGLRTELTALLATID